MLLRYALLSLQSSALLPGSLPRFLLRLEPWVSSSQTHSSPRSLVGSSALAGGGRGCLGDATDCSTERERTDFPSLSLRSPVALRLFPAATRLRGTCAMPLLHGRPSTQRQAQPGHVDLEETVSVQGPTGQTTAAAAMQSILNDAARQQGLGVGHPGHKGEGPARSSHWAACQLSFVGSTGLALLHTHLRLTGQLAPSDPVHEEAWHEIQLPATAQTLDVLLHAPSRRNGSGNSIVEFKRLVRSRMHEYIDFFNPSLLQQTRSLRNGVELPDESFFVPAVMSGEEGAGSVAWSN
ncbi:hypothetical protein BJY59DRAFT_213141 [Rhodotorula toruloides]